MKLFFSFFDWGMIMQCFFTARYITLVKFIEAYLLTPAGTVPGELLNLVKFCGLHLCSLVCLWQKKVWNCPLYNQYDVFLHYICPHLKLKFDSNVECTNLYIMERETCCWYHQVLLTCKLYLVSLCTWVLSFLVNIWNESILMKRLINSTLRRSFYVLIIVKPWNFTTKASYLLIEFEPQMKKLADGLILCTTYPNWFNVLPFFYRTS